MGINYNPRTITDGLVLCLDAANPKSYSGSGATWSDLSGNGNNGTLVNGVGYSGDNLGSLVFDGVDDYVNCDIGNLNNLPEMTGIVWVYKSEQIAADRFMSRRDTLDNAGWWEFLLSRDGNPAFYANFSASPTFVARESSQILSLNTWNMVSFTWKGTGASSDIKLYINSIETSYSLSTDNTGSRVNEISNNLIIGNAIWASRPFKGNMAALQLYNRALTSPEIQQNFNATKGRYGL
jgi:hypothetical protein